MSSSARKDRATVLSIHLAPPHLSKEEFVAQLNGVVDELVKTPIAQKNSLKFEMLIPNDELGSYLDACGLPKQKLVVCLVWECESEAHSAEVLNDPEFSKLFMQQETSGIYPGVCTFSTDTLLQFDFSGQGDSSNLKPVLAVGIFKLPDHLSAEKFYESVRAHTIAFSELPAVQKYQLVNYILWTPNNRIEQRFKDMGRSPTAAPIVQIIGAQTWDNFKELLSDPDNQKLCAEVMEKFRFGSDSYCFGADVITKINRV